MRRSLALVFPFAAAMSLLAGCTTAPTWTGSVPMAPPVAYADATVLQAYPVFYRERVVVPQQVCQTGYVTQQQGSTSGTLLGAVIGGLLGHQVGHGRGNTAATIGGAVAGGFLGNAVSGPTVERPVTRCGVVDTTHFIRRRAWRVEYNLNGRTGWTTRASAVPAGSLITVPFGH